MRSSAFLAVTVALAAPFGFSMMGCGGGGEWKPVAGPTVFPAMPPLEARPVQHAGSHVKRPEPKPETPPPAASASAAPASSGSAKPAASAKAPPPPPKKKLGFRV